jgi:hypothetical protein
MTVTNTDNKSKVTRYAYFTAAYLNRNDWSKGMKEEAKANRRVEEYHRII